MLMRFLPRYSLRFAWLALTIFLIGFGVARYFHQRYLRVVEHRQNIARLLASKYAIELEDAENGSEADQKVIGLYLPMGSDDVQIQALLDLSRPEDLLHLSLYYGDLTPPQQDRFFAKLAECKSLERLQLLQMNLTEAHVATLGTLGKLKFLHPGHIPVGSQHMLQDLNQLEDLRLSMEGYSEEELLRWTLPNLRVLFLSKCRWPELHLTKAGLGRFPLLEQVIVSKESQFDEVLCEPGAMPRLEYLSLAEQAKPCTIAWHALPDTAPCLRGLSVHASQFGFASREQLLRMPKLELLYFANFTSYEKFHDDRQVSPGITQALYMNQSVNFRSGFKPEMQEFLEARPELQFVHDYMDFIYELCPYREELITHGMGYARDHRPTIHWHPATLSYLYKNSGTNPNSTRQRRPARVISAEQPFLSGAQGPTPVRPLPYSPPDGSDSFTQLLLDRISNAWEEFSTSFARRRTPPGADPFAPADQFAPVPADPFGPTPSPNASPSTDPFGPAPVVDPFAPAKPATVDPFAPAPALDPFAK